MYGISKAVPLCISFSKCTGFFDHSVQEKICRWFIGKTANFFLCLFSPVYRWPNIWKRLNNKFTLTLLWVDRNPHSAILARHQNQFTITRWAGIVCGCLVCPYIFLSNRTVVLNSDFISNTCDLLIYLANTKIHVDQEWWGWYRF